MKEFNKVDFVKAWCYKILPLVYDDSLSYYEVLCKMKDALNQVIENVNNLPEFIIETIKEYITSGVLEEVVREILANYILNVKYPPTGIPPAVGDGTANDHAAIQGCIDYASANGYGAVYFPYGKYLTSPIVMKDKVGLYGFDRYSTTLVCVGGSSGALLSGKVTGVSIANLSLDGNNGFQVNDIDLINTEGADMLLYNLIFRDSFRHAIINSWGGHIQMSECVFYNCVEGALNITGTSFVDARGLLFNNVSTVGGKYVITIGASNGRYNFDSFATAPVCLVLNGNDNTIEAGIKNAVTNYEDNGIRNNINVLGKSLKSYVTDDVNSIIGGMFDLNITENFNTQVSSNYELSIDGTKIEAVGINKNLTVGGNITETIVGNKSVTSANSSETMSGDKTITANTITKSSVNEKTVLTGNKEVEGLSYLESLSQTKTINANLIYLNPVTPLKYGLPTTLNRYYNAVKMTDKNDTAYEVLVKNNNTALLQSGYANIMDYGAKGDGVTDDTQAFKLAIQTVASGQVIFLPVGNYVVDGITILKRITFIGETGQNSAGTVIIPNGTFNTFTVQTEGVDFYNIAFIPKATARQGAFITYDNVYRVTVRNCFFTLCYKAILIKRGSEILIDDCKFLVGTADTVQNSSLFVEIGTDAMTAPVNINNCLFRNLENSDTTYGIKLQYTDGVVISGCTINSCGIGIALNPLGTNICSYTLINNCVIDTCKYEGIVLTGDSTSSIRRTSINNTWCGNNKRNNIAITNLNVECVEITGCFLNEGVNGIVLEGANIKAVNINNNYITSLSASAIQITSAKDFIIANNHIGNFGFPNIPNNKNISTSNDSTGTIINNTFNDATESDSIGTNTKMGFNNGVGWTLYSPIVSSATGTIGNHSVEGYYCVNENILTVNVNIMLTSIGTGAGALNVTLPKSCKRDIVIPCKCGISSGYGFCASPHSLMSFYKYDGSFPLASGEVLTFTGTYEI